VSDVLLALFTGEFGALSSVSIAKGMLFVAVTGVLLYFLTLRTLDRTSAVLRERDAIGEHLNLLSRHANDIVLLQNEAGQILNANERAYEAYGHARGGLIGMHGSELRAPAAAAGFTAAYQQILAHGSALYETVHARKDGGEFPVEISARRIDIDGAKYVQAIIRDVSERKQAEARMARLTRIHGALSAINHAIVHATEEKALFQEICRIAVERAGLTLALIVLADDRTGKVHPVAWTGEPKDFVPKLDISFRDVPEGRRPIGIAIREQRTVVHQDIHAPSVESWGELARASGLRSLAVVPIRRAGTVAGAAAVYSSSADFFDAEVLALLEEMALDLSFSLDFLASERALVESEHRFRAVLEQSIAGMYVIQDSRIVYVNPRMREIFGYAPGEPVDPNPLAFVAESDRAMVAEQMARRLSDSPTAAYSIAALRKNGTPFTLGINAKRATYDGRPAIIAVAQDITEKAQAEEEIKRYIVRLQHALDSTIAVVSTIGEMRDPYTHGHEHRVGEIAASIAAEMGWDANRVEGIRIAGCMHDVGKISVPAEILAKPARLSPAEFELVKEHAQQSYEILKGVEFPWPVAQSAWQHHERLDGSGYPRGLKGDQIIIEARVLAVADVVEAMASHRPFRPGLGIERALAEIEQNRGKLFDPLVVDACLRLFREKGYQLPA